MYVYGSDDARDFWSVQDKAYTPPSGLVRGPSVIHRGGRYYVAYNTGWTGTTFGLAVSDDRRTWTHLADIDHGVAANNTWAPEFFTDAPDGKVRIVVSLSTGPTAYRHFQPYVLTALDDTLTKWSKPQPLEGISPSESGRLGGTGRPAGGPDHRRPPRRRLSHVPGRLHRQEVLLQRQRRPGALDAQTGTARPVGCRAPRHRHPGDRHRAARRRQPRPARLPRRPRCDVLRGPVLDLSHRGRPPRLERHPLQRLLLTRPRPLDRPRPRPRPRRCLLVPRERLGPVGGQEGRHLLDVLQRLPVHRCRQVREPRGAVHRRARRTARRRGAVRPPVDRPGRLHRRRRHPLSLLRAGRLRGGQADRRHGLLRHPAGEDHPARLQRGADRLQACGPLLRDEWYIVHHRFARPGGDGTHREVAIDRMRFTPDGTIQRIRPTQAGITPVRPQAHHQPEQERTA